MPGVTTLTVIVPVYNEQYLVQTSLRRLRVLGGSPLLSRIKIVVVDDTSTDETPAVLEQFRHDLQQETWGEKFVWTFLRHEHNQGKGAAVRTGLVHADTELTVIHDADLEYHPEDLLGMIPLFVDNEADAVYGSRFLSGAFRRALFFRHALGNHLLTFLCDLVCDLNLTDMETCYKMVRTRLLRSLPLESRDFRIEPELTIKLAKRGARLYEVPIRYSGRTYQEGKKINARDGLRALWAIIKYAVSDDIYVEDEYGSQILVRLRRAPRFTRWMADIVRPYVGQKVLEMGAGIGNLTVSLCPRPRYYATDINPLFLEDLQKLSHTRPYLEVLQTDVTDLSSFPSERRFDTVICLNLIEHVKDDVAALKNIRQVLHPGGRAIVLVPQGPKLYGSLDTVLGHYRRYTREQLIAAGEQAGLQATEVLEFNRLGTLPWWVNGRLLRRKTFGLGQIKLLNSLVPFIKRLDRWLPVPSLSLIAIFEALPGRQEGASADSPARSHLSPPQQELRVPHRGNACAEAAQHIPE